MLENEFVCKCGKMKMWIQEGQRTEPCPNCGREYIGRVNTVSFEVVGEEAHRRGWQPVSNTLNEEKNV